MGGGRQPDGERQERIRSVESSHPFGSWIDWPGACERGEVQSFWFRRRQCIGGDGSPGKKAAELSEIGDNWEPGADVCGRRRNLLC